MQLNLNQLETIGRIETVRRLLSDATRMVMDGQDVISVQKQMINALGELRSGHDELNFCGSNWDV